MGYQFPKGDRFAIAATILWGINYPMVKNTLKYLSETEFLFIRFSVSFVLLAIYMMLSGENFRISRNHSVRIILLGLLGVGIYNVIWTHGIHRTTAANAAILIATAPIFSGLWAVFTKQEKVTMNRWIGTLCAFFGIYLIVSYTPGASFSFDSDLFLGNITILFGAILVALYSIVAKPLLEHYSPTKLTTLAMAGGLLVIIPYCLTYGKLNYVQNFSLLTLSSMGYVIVLGTVLAFVFWYRGIKLISPVKALLFHYLIPIVSMVIGYIFLNESLQLGQVFGSVLVFLGLGIVQFNLLKNRRLNERKRVS